jgi:hypothetical protein
MIQDFKKEVEKIAEDEKMFQYRGKAFGDKYAEEWFRIFREHFSIGEVYEEEDLEVAFVEELAQGGNLSAIAYDHIQEKIDDGELNGCDLLDLSDDEKRAQFTAFAQANFTKEELFPETRPISISDSVNISGEVSRELETLQAENAELRRTLNKAQSALKLLTDLLHAN